MELSGKSSHNHYVLTGKVTQGWLLGAQAHVEFDAVPCPEGKVRCFAGAIRIMTGSAD